jgi:hypothetical protein
MKRGVLAVLMAFLTLSAVRAQQVEPLPEEKGTYLGVLISPVPEVLFDQLTDLPRGQGVVVTHVLPDSPAARAGLRRHDILLDYDGQKIRDCEHFARLIQADKPERKVRINVLRGGRSTVVEATLTLGTVLRIAQAPRPAANEPAPRGTAKGGGPPSVSVSVTPLEAGRLKLTVEYYQDAAGRLKTANYEGTLDEIQAALQSLPPRVVNYTQFAFKRIRELELQGKEPKGQR